MKMAGFVCVIGDKFSSIVRPKRCSTCCIFMKIEVVNIDCMEVFRVGNGMPVYYADKLWSRVASVRCQYVAAS